MTKLRQRTISGTDALEVPSASRPTKPPAKAITKRELETLDARTRGREGTAGEKPDVPRRTKVVGRGQGAQRRTPKRTGKRAPRQARALAAAEQRAKRPSRRAGNRAPDASARTVPVTRRHKGSRGARG